MEKTHTEKSVENNARGDQIYHTLLASLCAKRFCSATRQNRNLCSS